MNNTLFSQIYMDAQKSCGLKVGDWVKVVAKVEDDNPMWRAWCSKNMDSTVGWVGKIKDISPTGIEVYFGDCQYFYPYFVLEKVEKPAHEFKPFDKVLVRDSDLEIWRCNLFSHMGYDYYICAFSYYKQCISFNGNEHLCGTKDKPGE